MAAADGYLLLRIKGTTIVKNCIKIRCRAFIVVQKSYFVRKDNKVAVIVLHKRNLFAILQKVKMKEATSDDLCAIPNRCACDTICCVVVSKNRDTSAKLWAPCLLFFLKKSTRGLFLCAKEREAKDETINTKRTGV